MQQAEYLARPAKQRVVGTVRRRVQCYVIAIILHTLRLCLDRVDSLMPRSRKLVAAPAVLPSSGHSIRAHFAKSSPSWEQGSRLSATAERRMSYQIGYWGRPHIRMTMPDRV